jgi:hypothetical protein
MYVLNYERRLHDFSMFASHYVPSEQHRVEKMWGAPLKDTMGIVLQYQGSVISIEESTSGRTAYT